MVAYRNNNDHTYNNLQRADVTKQRLETTFLKTFDLSISLPIDFSTTSNDKTRPGLHNVYFENFVYLLV